jgi:hypothetical protein
MACAIHPYKFRTVDASMRASSLASSDAEMRRIAAVLKVGCQIRTNVLA